MIHEIIDIKIDEFPFEQPAKLYSYVLDGCCLSEYHQKRPCVIICPGGAYKHTSDREAEPVAIRMNAAGINTFVLRYHCAPARFPAALHELAASVAYVRKNAERYMIDPDRISVCGFSAGGHLACSLAEFWHTDIINLPGCTKEDYKPNGAILSYPVITSGEYAHRGSFDNLLGEKSTDEAALESVSLEKHVTENFPSSFVWHTFTDGSVPVENSLFLVSALRKAGVSTEFHMYPVGGHGLSLANEESMSANGGSMQEECVGWIDLATAWVKRLK